MARLRYLAGRHQTLWRVLSASLAVAVALALAPSGTPSTNITATADAATDAATDADVVETPRQATPVPGSVGVALPRIAAFPHIDRGSVVHAVAVNDPLVTGEVRATDIVVRSARVLAVDETSVTIQATEDDALALVEAMTTGSVVLVSLGEG